MPKTHVILVSVSLMMMVLAAACSAPVAANNAPQSAPTSAPAPAQPQNNAPSVQPTVGGAALAPMCQTTTTSSCAALDAEQIQLECVKKVPYTNVLLPAGTTYEVMDQSGSYACDDTGVVSKGRKVITCRGPEEMSFELKLTNASCGGTALTTGTGQCQDGYGFDAAQNCCAPVTGDAAGSTTVRVNLAGCPEPNFSNP
jgi:hypothetical protein